MGFFNIFKKEENKNDTVSVCATKDEALNKKINLRKEQVTAEAKKQNIDCNSARVVFVLDHSGSMSPMYENGTVQETLERILPLAMHFDDNSEMEFYLFDSAFKELSPVNCNNINKYVKKEILLKRLSYGGTHYEPVITEIVKRYGKKNPSRVPTFVVFITDGDNFDKSATKTALINASEYNVFWKFVGIGYERFSFLEELDTMSGRMVDNANFVSIRDISRIDDAALYEKLLTEYADWLKACREKNMID